MSNQGSRWRSSSPWIGVTLDPEDDANVLVDSGGSDRKPLVVERRVGAGALSVTAFSLAQRELWSWPSFDGFLNGCLLRRPSRVFSSTQYTGDLNVDWASQPERLRDPFLVNAVAILKPRLECRNRFRRAAGIGLERGHTA